MPDCPVLTSIAPFAATSDAWLLDVWGVLHNGVKPFPSTIEACRLFRAKGGTVVLVSNAPRPESSVVAQLDRIGVPAATYDGVVTSGDVSMSLVAAWDGRRILHIGPDRDRSLFAGLSLPPTATPADCDVAVCTGLYDDEAETPDDYRAVLGDLVARRVPMICANPDHRVERGGRIIFCAGAIAATYEGLGGEVRYAGKPYLPIYEMALERVAKLRGGEVSKQRLLAIGDGVATDIEGARRFGIRSVFVASGVHVEAGETIAEAATRLFKTEGAPKPVAVMTELAW